jgi:membrane-bound ClpP family serine protease
MFFSKPKDLRTEEKRISKHQQNDSIKEDLSVERTSNSYWKLLLIPFLPIFLLFLLLEYVHLLIFVIFGALFLYFGVIKITTNSLTETLLLFSFGLVLVVAPVMFIFDKEK